jgi:hypothetical protein
VEVQRGVEAEVNAGRRAPIAKGYRRPVIAGIEVDVDQHASRIVTGQFNIDFLPGRVSMEEEARDETGATSSNYLCLETSVLEGASGGKGAGTVRPISRGGLADGEMRA